jgi:hypothetical protein
MMRDVRRICRLAIAGALLASIAGAQQLRGPLPVTQAPSAPGVPCGPGLAQTTKNVSNDSRCFELRTYTVNPAGPGSLDLLHERFRQHTTKFFTKYGMTIVGFWHPTNKPNTLIYLMAYKDRASRDDAWAAFRKDPEWLKVRNDVNVAVTVEETFLTATDYSPMK